MSDLISKQVLELWNRYKPTIAVDAIEYDRELRQLLSTNLASLGTELISRQAAIDALAELARERFTIQDCFQIYLDALTDADVKIRQLPSAQPEPCEDAVSRQATIDIVEFECGEWSGLAKTIAEEIKQLPSAQPEIIRCRDCKHWIPYDWMFSEMWQSKNIADYPEDEIGCNWCDMAMKANDFCSRGEKREVTT